MKKELFFDRHSGLQMSALAENGKLIELGLENQEQKDLVGNIYKGKVINVIDSMNAAFIACGLEKNCYLSLNTSETVVDPTKYESDGKGAKRFVPLNVKEGDEIIVQVLKNPRGTKGAKVTTRLSFVGKNLIFLPETDFLGISGKIKEAELRSNLLFTADGLRGKNNGLIVRTVAPYTTLKRLKAEVAYLKNLYASVQEKMKNAQIGDVLYNEYDLPARVLRDSFNEDIEKIFVGDETLYNRLVALIDLRPDLNVENIELYQGKRDMFTFYGLAEQVKSLSQAKVELRGGANLVIERTEALTVVDVNTAKFIGDDNLEDTVYATNIAAAREIARQVRLRDIGGIVVVDFIDMAEERHRTAVQEELAQSLSADRVKCKVLPMNELCLVEFTRKRVSNGVASQLLQPCPHCKQSGYILSNEFTLCLLRSEILDCLSDGHGVVLVEMNRGLMNFLFKKKIFKQELSKFKGQKVYFVPHRTYHEEYFTVNGYASEREARLPEDAVLMK